MSDMYGRSFSVNWRNPGHWDIYAGDRGREWTIRGEPGNVRLNDMRRDENGNWLNRMKDDPDVPKKFTSVESAMAWITSYYMNEPLIYVADHDSIVNDLEDRLAVAEEQKAM